METILQIARKARKKLIYRRATPVAMTRTELINLLIRARGYSSYLEIGVNTPAQPGYNWTSVNTDLKHGVDPNPKVNATFPVPSDEFFAKHIAMKYDIVFVDGLHIFEQAHRDIENAINHLNEGGVVVVHDCNPLREEYQVREHTVGAWTGDVWKAILKLRMERSDLSICTVDTDFGCAVIQKGSQRLFKPDPKADIYSWSYFNAHRREILNLISVKQFKRLMNPIIMRISGGIGNQLFQYALGRALTLESGAPLALDISSYSNQKAHEAFRTCTLNRFNVRGEIATPTDFKSIGVPNPSDHGFIAKLRRNIIRMRESGKAYNERRIVLESNFFFIPGILNIKRGAFLAGVWQSEKYFKKYSHQIRKDFILKDALSSKAEGIKKLMSESESVAVHIRRGDQVSDPNLVKKHGLLTDEYYSNALKYMKSKLSNPRFFVFSDEIDWVKKNMDFGRDAVYVSEANLPDYEELTIMASCKHQIIAKSSFSWWAAWLNPNLRKLVIAPKQRFSSVTNEAKDLIPESWIQL